jgi:crossover junction endodeoxyribonuclease RusA
MTPDAEGFTFVVLGRAAPQGSKALHTKANGQKYMKESSDRVHPWRKKIMLATKGADGRPLAMFGGPVVIDIEFEFVKPKSNTDDYPTAHNIGDGDKLTRAVWDALTQAKVINDDAFCVAWSGSKHWGPEDRVFITVRRAPPLSLRPVGQAIIDEISNAHQPMEESIVGRSIVDFAEQIGVTLDPWQGYLLDEVLQQAPSCCNPVDHKGCLMFGAENTACPCPTHCTAD